MGDVSLTSAVRTSLLALKNTTELIDRTQNRLSTGLKVAGPTDDPVSYFQSKALTDRASDFTEKKDKIDQGISTVTSALDGIDGVESIVRQMKGLVENMKSATGTQFTDLVSQFNTLRSQVDALTADANYQGTNLINGTGTTLTVEFSEKTASKLTVESVDVTTGSTGLAIGSAVAWTTGTFAATWGTQAADTLSSGEKLTLTWTGGAHTYTTANDGVAISSTSLSGLLGTANSSTLVIASGSSLVVQGGDTFVINHTSTDVAQAFNITTTGASTDIAVSAQTVAGSTASYVVEGDSTAMNYVISRLDDALTNLRSQASTLGSNVALLQTRLDFTTDYVNTLEEGSAKLTLADINEEGANLLALQTRQQLGINSLSLAGQSEQSILSLFR